MSFRIRGLDPEPFAHLFGRTDADLAALGVTRCIADAKPGYPDRIEVRDVEPGEAVLLLNYEHQPARTAYRASHAIFIREGATQVLDVVGVIPDAILARPISLRAFDAAGEMVDADLVDGRDIEGVIVAFLDHPKVAYLHAHYAKRGCYAARIDRA